MADGNRSAIHVEFVHGDAEPVAAIDDLDGESFVEFPEVDVFDFQSLALEQLGHGEDGADAHFIGLATGDLKAAENQFVGDAEFVGALARHEQGR